LSVNRFIRQKVLMNDGVHNFLIDPPTGAPSHIDQSPIVDAQTQICARDLAAPMSRGRASAPHA